MGFEQFIEKMPEEDRSAFTEALKAEFEKYVPVDSLEKHPTFQSKLSLKHEDSMKRFQAEKLPVLIEEEIKKRGTKDPATLEIEKLRAEIAEERRNGLLKERKSQAIMELSKHGLDPELSDFVIAEDEEKFKSNIEKLTGKVTSWRDSAIKSEKEKIFSAPPPKGGNNPGAKVLPRDQFNSLPDDKKRAFISEGGKLE